VNEQTDAELLQAYAHRHSEAAFALLVRRHIDFVYSAARRMVCDPHLAEDVTQGVFVALARNAIQLSERSTLIGWLHRTAKNIAAHTVRTIERRRAREQEAVTMNELPGQQTDCPWKQIAPHLDSALGELKDSDREAILMRYILNQDFQSIGRTLNLSDDTAQKRVSRALERLREILASHGFTASASGLGIIISTHAVEAAPAGLAPSVSTTATSTATAGTTSIITMTLLKKSILVSAILVLCGGAVVLTQRKIATKASGNEIGTANLSQYVGRFEMPGHKIETRKEGDGIAVIIDGNQAFIAHLQSGEKFTSHDHNSLTEMTFVRDATGRVKEFALVRDGRKLGDLKRIVE
jgi:RNA polymerase sigma factor (sigma-70 family)